MYAALLVEAIKEIEEDNQAIRLEANGTRDDGRMPSNDDRGEYMGWIIDDFPGTAEQVQRKGLSWSPQCTYLCGWYSRI